MTLVRDAMLTDPLVLPASAAAQEAAEHLVKPDVRAVLVVDSEGRLVGLVTESALVVGVVASGRDPKTTPIGEIAVPAAVTLDAGLPVDEAYRVLEETDVERAPVTEDGRLVGVLSRSVLQRRLAEDEAPAEEPAEGTAYA